MSKLSIMQKAQYRFVIDVLTDVEMKTTTNTNKTLRTVYLTFVNKFKEDNSSFDAKVFEEAYNHALIFKLNNIKS
jgi:hypothetical protein